MSVDVSDLLPVIETEIEIGTTTIYGVSRREKYKHAITMIVLFLINLLNYMDRFIIAGVLDRILHDFNISGALGGLLQTVFVCSYMTLAPLFGYLGDRYSRKFLIIIGVTIWSLTTLAGSFVPKERYELFAIFRGLVGIGEASYACVAPTIIADMYKHDQRSTMLAIFNIAVPIGSGLGYIVGENIPKLFNGEWRWALRFTPILGAICVLLLIFLVKEPVRGSADGAEAMRRERWLFEVRQIFQVKSFVLTTLGFTWVAFALGSLSWWAPQFIKLAYKLRETPEVNLTNASHLLSSTILNNNSSGSVRENVGLIFGAITCVAGILGVLLGSEIAKRYRQRNKRADPIVCGIAVIIAVPFLVSALIFSKDSPIGSWISVFFAETLLCSNWAIITDMLMYIIVPSRRATASAIQIFTLHLLGDASSPYIVGEVSDFFQKGSNETLVEWRSLRNGLLLTPGVSCLGGILFLVAALFIVQDRYQAEVLTESTRTTDTFRMEEPSKS